MFSSRSTNPIIRFKDVVKSYRGDALAVDGASFSIYPGEIAVLLGSSGSGKSTLLRMINGLVSPSQGEVEVRDQSGASLATHQARRSIGYISQGIALFPFLRLWENISLPLRLRGVSAKERRARAENTLELVDLPPSWADRLPAELSGGQQQRVAVARALITGTDIVLMDEPFGALDMLTREALQAEVLRLREKLGVTVVFVTHDLFEALTLADRIIVMHMGRIEQVGTPHEVLHRPASNFVRDLFEKPARLLRASEET